MSNAAHDTDSSTKVEPSEPPMEEENVLLSLGANADLWCGVHNLAVDIELLSCALSHELVNESATDDVTMGEIPYALMRLAGRARVLSERVDTRVTRLKRRVDELERQLAEATGNEPPPARDSKTRVKVGTLATTGRPRNEVTQTEDKQRYERRYK